MARRIAVIGAAGGAGRTSLVLNLAITLVRSGQRTAVLDLAPQGGLGAVLACSDWQFPGLSDCLGGTTTPTEALRKSATMQGLGLLFRGQLHPMDEPDYEVALSSRDALDGVLGELDGDHDLLLMDTPTGLGGITRAALGCASRVLVILEPTPIGLRATARALRLIEQIQRTENPELEVVGILASKVRNESPTHREVLRILRAKFPEALSFEVPYAEPCLHGTRVGRPLALPPVAVTDYVIPIEGLAARVIEDQFAVRRGSDAGSQGSGYARFGVPGSTGHDHGNDAELDFDSFYFEGGQGGFGPEDWEGFLDSCIRATGAISAFVLDGGGLAIANVGELPESASLELGARLVVVLEQAAKMGAAADDLARLSVELDERWLTGFAASASEGERFVLGLLCPNSVPTNVGADIATAFQKVLDRPFGSGFLEETLP